MGFAEICRNFKVVFFMGKTLIVIFVVVVGFEVEVFSLFV